MNTNSPKQAEPVNRPAPVVIPYATPASFRESGCWRRGKQVIVTHDFEDMPKFCFVCGRPANDLKSGHIEYSSFAVPLKMPTLAMFSIPLCDRHRRRVAWMTSGSKVFLCYGAILCVVAMNLGNLWAVLFMIAGGSLVILAPIMARLGKLPAKAVEYDGRYVVLEGAGEEFLEKLKEK